MRAARLTIRDIQNSACAHLNRHLFDDRHGKEKGGKKGKQRKPRTYQVGGRLVVKHFPKASGEKNSIEIILIQWTQQHCLELFEEYVFVTDRGWRFDWCIPEKKLAIEYEGLMSDKSGHTTVAGYTKDTEKYNRAAQEGWTVLRFTALNYNTLIDELKKLK